MRLKLPPNSSPVWPLVSVTVKVAVLLVIGTVCYENWDAAKDIKFLLLYVIAEWGMSRGKRAIRTSEFVKERDTKNTKDK